MDVRGFNFKQVNGVVIWLLGWMYYTMSRPGHENIRPCPYIYKPVKSALLTLHISYTQVNIQ